MFDERREYAEHLQERTARACELDFYTFLVYFWDTVVADPFIPAWHIRYLCNEAQKIGELVIAREPVPYNLIVNVPPGTSKSTIFTIMFPAWLWLRSQSLRILTGSHSMSLSIEHAVKSRDVLKSEKFGKLYPNKIIFKADQDNKSLYENTNHGQRITCSVGKSPIGRHAHIVGLDDIINPEESESELLREKAVRFMNEGVSQRVVDRLNTPILLIMQRLHVNDPTGYLIEKMKLLGKKIKLIVLPADDSLDNIFPSKLHLLYKMGKNNSKLLDPVRLSDKAIDNAKIDLGDRGSAGQLFQSPMAAGGNIIKLDSIKPFTELPSIRPISIIQSWDTAFKKGETSSYNCCGTWYEFPHGYYLVDMYCERLNFPELKKMVVALASEWSPHKVLVENKATGSPVMQELGAETRINFVSINPQGDKPQRAHACSPAFDSGNVYILGNAPWTNLFMTEITMFPNGKIDDIMDMTSQYLNHVRVHTGSMDFASSGSRRTKSLLRGFV